jgi:hypothetical protein
MAGEMGYLRRFAGASLVRELACGRTRSCRAGWSGRAGRLEPGGAAGWRTGAAKGGGLAGLGGLAGGYLLADDGGDTVAAHRDAVQGVGGFHRPALVRDHDELGTLPQLIEDKQQAL